MAAFDVLQNNNKGHIVEEIRGHVAEMRMSKEIAEEVIESINNTTLQFSLDGAIDEKSHPEIFMPLKMARSASKGSSLHGLPTDRGTGKQAKFSLGVPRPGDWNEDGEVDQDKLADEMLAANGIITG